MFPSVGAEKCPYVDVAKIILAGEVLSFVIKS